MKTYRKLLACVLTLAALCAPLSNQTVGAAPDAPDAPAAPFALVKDIQTAPQPTDGMRGSPLFVTVGNTIFFSGYTPHTGNELWRTDGSEAGTTLVKDIRAGEGSSIDVQSRSSVVLNGALLFAADDGALGGELWRSDGTPGGPARMVDTQPGFTSSAIALSSPAGLRRRHTRCGSPMARPMAR